MRTRPHTLAPTRYVIRDRFLGVSYTASLLVTRRPKVQIVPLVLLPPITLLLGGLVAGKQLRCVALRCVVGWVGLRRIVLLLRRCTLCHRTEVSSNVSGRRVRQC